MNKRQKLVQQAFLDNEKEVLKRLEKTYSESLTDIEKKAKKLQDDIENLDKLTKLAISDEEKEELLSRQRSKVYQKQYQEALKKQVSDVLDKMHKEEFKTVSEYLDKCYEEGFVGSLFDLQGQGIPLIFPIDQESVVRAVQLDSKISKKLYSRLGEDVTKLKKLIASDVSRGISTGMTFKQIAGQLKAKTNIGYNNAVRIARTEGHRIQCQAGMDACYKAKEVGADVVKQWDAALDSRTRESHSMVDGEIRELDEKFSNGLMFPGDPNGGASEVINCRCALLQRARRALDDSFTKMNNETGEIVDFSNIKDYKDFKEAYLKKVNEETYFIPATTIKEAEEFAKRMGVKYVDYSKLPLDTANGLNKALATLPDDVRPVFVGSSDTLEQYWGGKLPRNSKHYYGVTIDTYDGIHLGLDENQGHYIVDYDTYGQMVGISSSYKSFDKITDAKRAAQLRYQQKHNGEKWFFNDYGESTPFHEMGHVYEEAKGIPEGFAADAMRWARESKCKMLEKTSEAWAEAWGAYYTDNPDLPDYISKYIKDVSGKSVKNSQKGLIFFDDDGIISTKKSVFKKDFTDGKISTRISPQKQARHIKGSKQFNEYVSILKSKGDDNLPSYIREDMNTGDLKRLVVNKLKGNVRVNADDSYEEFVTCDEVIGYYYSPSKGKYIPTKCAQVKYSLGKGNIHIIPVKEKGGDIDE